MIKDPLPHIKSFILQKKPVKIGYSSFLSTASITTNQDENFPIRASDEVSIYDLFLGCCFSYSSFSQSFIFHITGPINDAQWISRFPLAPNLANLVLFSSELLGSLRKHLKPLHYSFSYKLKMLAEDFFVLTNSPPYTQSLATSSYDFFYGYHVNRFSGDETLFPRFFQRGYLPALPNVFPKKTTTELQQSFTYTRSVANNSNRTLSSYFEGSADTALDENGIPVGSLDFWNSYAKNYYSAYQINSTRDVDPLYEPQFYSNYAAVYYGVSGALTASANYTDFILCLFEIDPTTKNLVFKSGVSPYTLNTGYYNYNSSSGTSFHFTGSHQFLDAKYPLKTWFDNIHNNLPEKSAINVGDEIPYAVYTECYKMGFNLRLDLLGLSASDFPEGKFTFITNNAGLFVKANTDASAHYVLFHGTLNSDENINNLFLEISYLPFGQMSSALISSEDPPAEIQHLLSKSYYESFNKVGGILKQKKPLPSSWDCDTHFDSFFDFAIIANHLDPGSVDLNNLDLKSFIPLYLSNYPKKDFFGTAVAPFSSGVNTRIKSQNMDYFFPYYKSLQEGVDYTYGVSFFTVPKPLPFYTENTYYNYNPNFLKSSAIPYSTCIYNGLDSLILGGGQDYETYIGSQKNFPPFFNYIPVAIGAPSDVELSEADYIRRYGNYFEFDIYLYSFDLWDVGTYDDLCVGVYFHNSSKFPVYAEHLSGETYQGLLVSPESLGQYLGEFGLDKCRTHISTPTYTGTFSKYLHTLESSGIPMSSEGPLPAKIPTFYSSSSGFNNGFLNIRVPPSMQTTLTKQYSIKMISHRFRVYLPPINGYELSQVSLQSFYPGYVEDPTTLRASGILDFSVEVAKPLWDSSDSTYKYAHINEGDKDNYLSVFRVFTGILFPRY